MDRNLSGSIKFCNVNVALRKESVDRNILPAVPFRILRSVALRKESVDRNAD